MNDASAVRAEATGTSGNLYGVYGITNSPGSASGSAIGVYGLSASPTATGGASFGVLGRSKSIPGVGSSTSAGVFGWGDVSSGSTYGVWGETGSSTNLVSGVYGVNTSTSGQTRGTIGVVNSTTGGAAGVLGSAPSSGAVRGVMGFCHSASGYGIYSDGNFAVAPGYTKSGLVETAEGVVKFYCQESPEVWFEDFGEAQLIEGRARVRLDALFLETVTINASTPMKVFITVNGDCEGVYVRRGTEDFEVVELHDGKSVTPRPTPSRRT